MLLQRLSSLSVWDDAYFFVRYADNLLTYGQLAWNPDGIPTYGLTSPAYLIIVVPLRLIFPTQPALVMICASLLCGVLAGITIVRFGFTLLKHQVHQTIFVVLLAISSVVAGEHITLHLTSGMDTMFAVLCLTIWLMLIFLSQKWGLAGVLAGSFLWIRPDVLLIVVPIIVFLVSHSQSKELIIIFSATIIIQLLLNQIYFSEFLPLPFYAKSTTIYGEAFYRYYVNTANQYFVEFLLSYPYLMIFAFIGSGFTLYKKYWHMVGVIFGIVLFTIYQLYFVVPVMGFSQRFYYPLLPVIIFLVIKAIPVVIDQLPANIIQAIKTYPNKPLFVPLLLVFVFINPLPIIITFVNFTKPNDTPVVGVGRFDLQIAYDTLYNDSWYRLDAVSALNDEIVIATTEIGFPAVMNPNKTIFDLAGLNNTYIAHRGFSADYLLVETQPDWIYMPYPHYEDMWYSIFNHPTFEENYHYFSARMLGTAMDVAIKRSSPFYRDMLEIVNQYE